MKANYLTRFLPMEEKPFRILRIISLKIYFPILISQGNSMIKVVHLLGQSKKEIIISTV